MPLRRSPASVLSSTQLYHSRSTIYDLPTMAKWTFEPGHTAAEFCARHMMVTYVRGHFKDVHGSLNFDRNIRQPLPSKSPSTRARSGLASPCATHTCAAQT